MVYCSQRSDKVHDRYGLKQPIYDISFKPDGTQLIAAAGAEVLVYDVAEGDLIQSLKAHKDTVYAVEFSADGTRFASGGADKQVIIWNSKMEGILKYSHNDSIQAISHNPVTGQVVSCTASDFGLWSSEQKTVTKHKVPARILAVSWTNDGQYFALGLYNGNISIRNRTGEEKVRIERGTSPVWSLQWSPATDKDVDLLAVTDWSQRLSYFQLSGRQVGKDRHLGLILPLGGSDHKVTLWTAEGIRLGQSVSGRAGSGVARYAYRENMTDVVIQHLSTDQRARIKCRDYVKKIAVFRDRLAHIILCLEKKLQMYHFNGDKEREWNLEALIRYIKVTGGPRGREGLLSQPSKLAVVDEHNTCLVYDLKTKELLFQEPNANSVAWNTELEDVLCYSGNGVLNIKAGNFPAHQQKMQGFVVGFKGYLEKKEYERAYDVACLGVTEGDWRRLALESLEGLCLPIASKAFSRLRDLKFIDLITLIERLKQPRCGGKEGINSEQLKCIQSSTCGNTPPNSPKKTNSDRGVILKRKAQIQQDRNDWLQQHPPTLKKHNHHAYAAECLVKLGDISHLLNLHIELQQWDDAFRIAETHPKFAQQIYLPYANWLAMNDKYMDAQLNFRKAESLPDDLEKRSLNESQRQKLKSAKRLNDPFTSHLPESLLNMARFIVNYLSQNPLPSGISRSYVYYAIAKLSRTLGAFKLARYAYDKLTSLVGNSDWCETIEIGALSIRAKASADKEDLLPICFACSTVNPLINLKGDACSSCSEPFVRSFYSFEMLPLVQFVPEDGISDEEAEALIRSEQPGPTSKRSNGKSKKSKRGDDDSGLDGGVSIDEDFEKQVLSMGRTTSVHQELGKTIDEKINTSD
ncbi:WD40-repeat-containing domain protein [Chytridium lagenaria]|nr:WD40-repeat-containing domain protein [Chytridium lagenaria]